MSNFKPIRLNRQPTSQTYGLRETKSLLPKPEEKQSLVVQKTTPPSYKFVNEQKGVRDTHAEDKDKEDQQIREEQGKDKEDEEQPRTEFKKPENKVIENQKFDQGSTAQRDMGSKEFTMFWANEIDYDLEEVTESEKNSWTPNAFAMFEILEAAHTFVTDNRVVLKKHPEFLDYAVACYYSIIFFLQILRAKREAGMLVGRESKFFRRFERKYKMEELPITGILVPYFSTICSTMLGDKMYNWIIPDVAPGMFSATLAGFGTSNDGIQKGGIFLQPQVPYMLSILRTAIDQTRIDNLTHTMRDAYGGADPNDVLAYFNDDDEYVPGKASANRDSTVFGMILRTNTNDDNYRNSIYWASGVSYPFHASADQLIAACPKWKKTAFKNLGKAGNGTLAQNTLFAGTKPITALDEFLCMEEESDLEWFEELIYQAAIHARFFGKVYNLSNIPASGGDSTLITCELRKSDGATFNNAKLGHTTLNVQNPWYPQDFRNFLGGFYTTRNGTKRQEILQAMSFGTNATLNVGAAADHHRVGEHPDHYRKGPYWKNKVWTATKFEGLTQAGKPMFRNWKTMVQQNAAVVTPEGYY